MNIKTIGLIALLWYLFCNKDKTKVESDVSDSTVVEDDGITDDINNIDVDVVLPDLPNDSDPFDPIDDIKDTQTHTSPLDDCDECLDVRP